jgi:hypothetical protein
MRLARTGKLFRERMAINNRRKDIKFFKVREFSVEAAVVDSLEWIRPEEMGSGWEGRRTGMEGMHPGTLP